MGDGREQRFAAVGAPPRVVHEPARERPNPQTAIPNPQSKAPFYRKAGFWGFLFICPWLLGFLLFTAGPMLASIVLSLCKYDLHTLEYVGTKNYERLLTREREQSMRQGRGALRRLGGGIEQLLDAEIVALDAPLDEVERRRDDAQHVVEVVGNAAGELADRLHFLRLSQLAFDLLTPAHLVEKLLVGKREAVARGGELTAARAVVASTLP